MTAKATKSAATPRLPDVAAMEAYVADHAPDVRERALSKAQQMMYDAWERKTARGRKAMAAKAIAACPLCADGFNLLAEGAANAEDAAALYRLALTAAELALGPEGFADFEGEFWGFLETRPYMRARHGLALAVLELDQEDEAITHFRGMLELNPGDNQGIRYLLLALLLRRDDIAAVDALLDAYGDEWSIQWLYTRALLAFRRNRTSRKATRKMLKDAFEANPHVPAILAGTERAVLSSDGLVFVGSPGEATEYLMEFGDVWRKTEGAVAWLAAAREATG